MKKIIVDTNVLMQDINLSNYEKVIVPVVVLEELDKHKHSDNSEKSYKARRAVHKIKNANNIEFKVNYSYSLPIWLDVKSPDNIGNIPEFYSLAGLDLDGDIIDLNLPSAEELIIDGIKRN